MNIYQLSVSNILGINEITIRGGKFIEVSGHNGAGKTSVLEAIKAGLQGGNDATLLRNGTSRGEVVIEFDNNMTTRKTVEGDKSTLVVKQDGMTLKSPATALKEIVDMVAVNPVELLNCKPERRLELLLQSAAFDVDPHELGELSGNPTLVTSPSDVLDKIDGMRRTLYDERTGVNRIVTEKKSILADAERVNADVTGLVYTADDLESIDMMLSAARTEHDEAINELRTKYEAERAAMVETYNNQRTEALRNRDAVQRDVEARSQNADRIQAIAQLKADVENYTKESEGLTARIDAIDDYKTRLISSFPIDGVTIVDGNVYIDGVPFDRVNEARRVTFAMDVATRRETGKVRVICMDGLERLDDATYDALRQRCEAIPNAQFIVTRRTNGPLTVTGSDTMNESNDGEVAS